MNTKIEFGQVIEKDGKVTVNAGEFHYVMGLLRTAGARCSDLSRGYDQVIKILEQRDSQLDNQAETIDQLGATVNIYAERINALLAVVDTQNAMLEKAAAKLVELEDLRSRGDDRRGT